MDCADSASSNRKAALYAALQSNPKKLLCFAPRCMVHQLFRSIVTVLERLSVLKSLFAITSILNIAHRQNQFRRALVTIVADDLKTEYHQGLAPPPADSLHRQQSRELVSRLLIDRASRKDLASPLADASNDETHTKVDSLCEMLHLPWNQEKAGHCCLRDCACGGSRAAAVGFIVELYFWLFCTMMPDSPSFSRWTTLGPCCAWFAICLLPHGVFRRAWRLAFDKEVLEGVQPIDQDDIDVGHASFSAVIGRRIKQATTFLKDEVALVASITIALVTQPMDQLVLTLLKFDMHGRLLADLTSKRVSPARDAQRKFVEMLSGGMVTLLVGDYFRMNNDQRRELMSDMRNMIIELAAGIHFRMDLYFGRFPFLLLRLVHPDRPLREHIRSLIQKHHVTNTKTQPSNLPIASLLFFDCLHIVR